MLCKKLLRESWRPFLLPTVAIAATIVAAFGVWLFRGIIKTNLGQDLWSNLLANAISFPVETGVVYLIINSVLAAREESRARPAREIIGTKLVLLHRMIFRGVAIALKPPSSLNLAGHYSGPELGKPAAAFSLRATGLAALRHHLDEFREILDLGNRALDANWMPVLFAHYSCAKRVIAVTEFYLAAFHPENIGKKDFISEFPIEQLRTMQRSCEWVLTQFSHLDKVQKQGILKSPDELFEMFKQAEIEWPHLCGAPELYKFRTADILPVVENADIMRRINPAGIKAGQQIYMASLAS